MSGDYETCLTICVNLRNLWTKKNIRRGFIERIGPQIAQITQMIKRRGGKKGISPIIH